MMAGSCELSVSVIHFGGEDELPVVEVYTKTQISCTPLPCLHTMGRMDSSTLDMTPMVSMLSSSATLGQTGMSCLELTSIQSGRGGAVPPWLAVLF